MSDMLACHREGHRDRIEQLEAENAKLRDALAHMLAFARRNWPEGVPDFYEQAVVIHATETLKRGTP